MVWETEDTFFGIVTSIGWQGNNGVLLPVA
jgi:hypothetical protein